MATMRSAGPWLALATLLAVIATGSCGSDDAPASNPGAGGSVDAGNEGTGGTVLFEGGIDVSCPAGPKVCTGTVAHDCGKPASTGTDCATSGKKCVEGLGCAVCSPGPISCSATAATMCKKDGSGVIEFACDPDMGLSCLDKECMGPCSPSVIEDSYIGCEYYPTTVLNNVNNSYDFEVAVANSFSTDDAHVKITGGSLTFPISVTIPAGQVERIPLPWQTEVKVCNETSLGNAFDQVNACSAAHNPDYTSRVVAQGAYRLLSDRPIAAYQFAPIQSSKSGAQAGTTEASLLIPQTVMGNSYRVATYGQGFARGAVAIVATLDGTTIDVVPTTAVTAAPGYATGIAAGQKATFTANRGDVVELIAATAGQSTNDGDLTGTAVTANHPVEVFGVHGCAWVINTQSCDHLEDTMFPDVTLGTEYVVKAARYAGSVAYLTRIVALEDNTTVTFNPPTVSADKQLNAGQIADISAADVAVFIKADRRVLVAGLNEGDNTLALVVPTARFRNSYLFLAPDFQYNYVKLLAVKGAAVTLDGTPIAASSFETIGSSGWSWAIVPISKGPHHATSDKPFGVTVFGNQDPNATPGGLPSAYEYPGGLDLHETTVPPPPK